jgi:hypothetical protein
MKLGIPSEEAKTPHQQLAVVVITNQYLLELHPACNVHKIVPSFVAKNGINCFIKCRWYIQS